MTEKYLCEIIQTGSINYVVPEIIQDTPESRCLEFFYCVYTNNIKDSRFMCQTEKYPTIYLTESQKLYREDPLFHAMFNLNVDIVKEMLSNQ